MTDQLKRTAVMLADLAEHLGVATELAAELAGRGVMSPEMVPAELRHTTEWGKVDRRDPPDEPDED